MSLQDQTPLPTFAGRSFHVEYEGLGAHNIYSADARSVRYAIVSGPYAGASGEAACQWRQIAEGVYVISWQEADGATVVHVDDFATGHSQAFFTATDLTFHRMQGPLTELAAQESAQ
ncbi:MULTISPECIES: MoaF-related domain-containing protein [Pseudomonas]|uniref:MoaF-related domain-containing protein n=1 Tax=Pseudomonas TaxID=286 RepID=UPI002B40F4EE|nr:adenylate cyclase [Pseudomonas sichuanensis]